MPKCCFENFPSLKSSKTRVIILKARSCQSFSASHIDQRDISAFHRPIYKRPGVNRFLTLVYVAIIANLFNIYCRTKFKMVSKVSVVITLILLISAICDVVLSAFTCGDNCWRNDWGTRDSEARKHGFGAENKRCDHPYFWGGTCFCYGPPYCVDVANEQCGHNCWHNDWRQRDQRAQADGQSGRRCSYGYSYGFIGGRCYCYGSPVCT